MVPVIVPAYAALFAFIYLVLSVQVIPARRQAKIAIGTRGHVRLERKIRVHANELRRIRPVCFAPSLFRRNAGWSSVAHTSDLPGVSRRPCHPRLWRLPRAGGLQTTE